MSGKVEAVKRLLTALRVIREKLGAAECVVEIGEGRKSRPTELVRALEDGVQLVVRFQSSPPGDAPSRLETVLEGLGDLRGEIRRTAPTGPVRAAQRDLSELLSRLSQQTSARRAVVIDTRSPVVFGDSHDSEGGFDVDDALHAARLARRVSDAAEEVAAALEGPRGPPLSDREWLQLEAMTRPPPGSSVATQLHLSLAIADIRNAPPQDERLCSLDGSVPLLARRIASIYWVILVFDGRFSEVRADGHLVHALQPIERLVVSLPPLDPKGGAKARHLHPV